MNKRRLQRAPLLTCGLLLMIVAVPVVLTWRAWNQQKVNRRLSTALEQNNSAAVAASLEAGANPNAVVTVMPSTSLWEFCQSYIRLHQHDDVAASTPIFRVQPYPLDRGGPHHHIGFPGKNVRIMKMLVDSGADINAPDEQGCTELMHAIDYDQDEVVSFLIKHQARWDVKDKQGYTALQHAKLNEGRPYARLLQQYGAQE